MEENKETVTVVTDGAYPAPRNQKLAEEKNVQIISTNMTGRKANDFYADFVVSNDGKTILRCPGGLEPISISGPYKNGQIRVTFPSACCANCPHKDKCPANKGKRISSLVISMSSVNRAKTQRKMKGDEGANYAQNPVIA